MGTYAEDYRWQLQFQPAVEEILTETFGVPKYDVTFTSPESEDDRHYNTDIWIMVEGHPLRVSQRIRRYVIGDDFTLRYFRPGALTEWQKVWAGFGDYLFYGRGRDRRVDTWFIGKMDVLRRWVSEYLDRGEEPPHVTKTNADGSSEFVVFSRSALPSEFTVAEDLDLGKREVCWAIVKDARGLNDSGHGAAVRWARAWLGLDP